MRKIPPLQLTQAAMLWDSVLSLLIVGNDEGPCPGQDSKDDRNQCGEPRFMPSLPIWVAWVHLQSHGWGGHVSIFTSRIRKSRVGEIQILLWGIDITQWVLEGRSVLEV